MIVNVVIIDRYADGTIEVNFKSFSDMSKAKEYYDNLIVRQDRPIVDGDEYWTLFEKDENGDILEIEIMESRIY